MRIPGPSDLVNAVSWVGSSVDTLTELLPRVVTLVDSVEGLVERIHQVIDRAELTINRVDDTMDRVDGVIVGAESAVVRADAVIVGAEAAVARADGVLTATEEATARATGVLDAAEATTARVDATVSGADQALGKASKLLDDYEPPLTTLKPTIDKLAETTHPEEIEALVHVIDMLPELTDSLRDDVLPMLKTLDSVGPDVRELLMVSRELNEMLGSLPGMGRIKKRVEEEQAEEEAERPDPREAS